MVIAIGTGVNLWEVLNSLMVGLKNIDWMKRGRISGKVGHCAKFLEDEKFSFQRAISKFVLEHDIPPDLVLNLDLTQLS